MKKIITVLCLSLAFTLPLVGCSKKSSNKTYTKVADLISDKYASSQAAWDPETNAFKAEYISEDHDSFYFVECTMKEDTYNSYNECFMGEDEEEVDTNVAKLLDGISDLKITCQNDNIPSGDTFSQYVGKTLGDLDADGYCSMNTTVDDEGYYVFYRYNDQYVVEIHSDEKTDDPSVLPEDDTSIVIKDISFYEFSVN